MPRRYPQLALAIAQFALLIALFMSAQEKLLRQRQAAQTELTELQLKIDSLKQENAEYLEPRNEVGVGATVANLPPSEPISATSQFSAFGELSRLISDGTVQISSPALVAPDANLNLSTDFAEFFQLTPGEYAELNGLFVSLARQASELMLQYSQLAAPETLPNLPPRTEAVQVIRVDPPPYLDTLRQQFEDALASTLGPDRLLAFNALQPADEFRSLPGTGGARIIDYLSSEPLEIYFGYSQLTSGGKQFRAQWYAAPDKMLGGLGTNDLGSFRRALGLFAPLLPDDFQPQDSSR